MAVKSLLYQNQNFEIAYHLINNKSEKNMVFLHGWGSNKELMQTAFKEVFLDFNHYYIDLPGFGRSPNNTALFTQDYAQIIKLFLTQIHIKADVVVGHSFGGKVAMLLESEIILLSSAGILEPKPFKVKLKIFFAKMLKQLHLKGDFLRSKDALNLNLGMYQTFKNVVDEDFSSIFSNFKHKASIFWGKEDKATSLASGEKISKLIKNSRFYPLEGDHYFFMKQGKKIDTLYHKEKK